VQTADANKNCMTAGSSLSGWGGQNIRRHDNPFRYL